MGIIVTVYLLHKVSLILKWYMKNAVWKMWMESLERCLGLLLRIKAGRLHIWRQNSLGVLLPFLLIANQLPTVCTHLPLTALPLMDSVCAVPDKSIPLDPLPTRAFWFCWSALFVSQLEPWLSGSLSSSASTWRKLSAVYTTPSHPSV